MYSKISHDDILDIAGLTRVIDGRGLVDFDAWGEFTKALIQVFNEEIGEQVREALKRSLGNDDIHILVQITGKDLIVLGSFSPKPDLAVLADVQEIETLLSISQVKTLVETNEVTIDNWTKYQIIKVDKAKVVEGQRNPSVML